MAMLSTNGPRLYQPLGKRPCTTSTSPDMFIISLKGSIPQHSSPTPTGNI